MTVHGCSTASSRPMSTPDYASPDSFELGVAIRRKSIDLFCHSGFLPTARAVGVFRVNRHCAFEDIDRGCEIGMLKDVRGLG